MVIKGSKSILMLLAPGANTCLSKYLKNLFGIYQTIGCFLVFIRRKISVCKKYQEGNIALEVTNWIKIRRVDNRSPLQSFLYLLRKKSPLASSYYHPTISLPKQIFLNPRNVETLSKHQNSNLIMVQINSAANSKSYLGVLFSLEKPL